MPKAPNTHQHKGHLARTIYSMPYGELMSVADDLSGMIDKDVRPRIKTQQEFADALYDWAEATVHELDHSTRTGSWS